MAERALTIRARPALPAIDVRGRVLAGVKREASRTFALAKDLYRHPELSGEERRSCLALARILRAAGFRVQVGLANLPTAFRAALRRGRGGARVGLLAEYDALPGIGHGCGHNLIAAWAVGAAIAARAALEAAPGEVQVIGTPAEETIGGKVTLAEAGVFDGLDAAMMIHPSAENRVYTTSLAAVTCRVEFHGRAAHAVVHPEKGINALDAIVDLYRSAPELAREIGDGARLPGVIREGGLRPNVIPDFAAGEFSLRSRSQDGLNRLLERFRSRAGEIAGRTGCRLDVRPVGGTYREMRTNRTLADRFREHLLALGRVTEDGPRTRMGSLDMGNVSHRVPAIHPFLAIAPPEFASHTAEFAKATVGPSGRAALLAGTRALALTVADLVLEPDLRRRAGEEFRREEEAPA